MKMNIVFCTSEEIHHYYLINEIHKYFPVKKVFYQTCHSDNNAVTKRLKAAVKNPGKFRFLIRALLMRLLFNKEIQLRSRYESRMFFNGAPARLDPGIPTERVFSFNQPEAVTKVEKEDPDLIIVFGTELLKGKILETAKVQILNIHRDILPKYRGGGLPSWIFYHKDFQNLGTTVHICAKKLDAGDIVGQRYYSLQKDDSMATLRYKLTVLSLEVLKEVISQYQKGKVKYKKQEKSKLWTSKDMTVFKEIIARSNLSRYVKTL